MRELNVRHPDKYEAVLGVCKAIPALYDRQAKGDGNSNTINMVPKIVWLKCGGYRRVLYWHFCYVVCLGPGLQDLRIDYLISILESWKPKI